MARRELSSTLRNLKFMQRADLREEEPKKEEEIKPDGNFSSPGIARKCVVIMEGDPHPGAIKGRMSFQSFNPFVDKLIAKAANAHPPATSTTSWGNQSEKMSTRENGCSDMNEQSCTTNGDLKRKQSDVGSFNTPPRNLQDNQSSVHNTNKGSFKKPKSERPDWNVLLSPKHLSKRS